MTLVRHQAGVKAFIGRCLRGVFRLPAGCCRVWCGCSAVVLVWPFSRVVRVPALTAGDGVL